ncbi:restriction endonuclease subunit S [Chryseobacterium sp. UNC8MFCol]|nr:restriction endonuclease subunit S [Chryseobacterium sp. UNC8MFCol]
MTEENKSVKNFPNLRNVPKLRFSQFTDPWENEKLGELMTFKVTNSYSRDNLNYESGTVKNIHYGDIHTKFQTLFDLEKENVPYINEDIPLSRISEDFYCQEGDIIFADASEDLNDVGKSIEVTNLNGEKLLSGLHTLLARPQKNIFFKGFLGYLLKSDSVRNQIKREAQGSKVLSINAGRISNIYLSFPSFSEQHKISECLSLMDKRIQTQKKIIEKLESLMQGWRERIFSQKVRFKNEGNNFSSWEIKKLKDISIRITTKNIESNKNVLTISAQYGLISQLDFFSKSVSAKNIDNYYLLEKNDFAYNKSYSNGYPMGAIKQLINYKKGVVSTLYICFRFHDYINSEYMKHYFDSGYHNVEIEKIAQEGARNHGLLNISITDFFDIKISLPSREEQTKIANFLSSIQEKLETEKQILEKLELQKKFLLANLFV